MSTAIVLIRLRWTLTLATLRKSVWQTVAYVFSLLLVLGVIVGIGWLAVNLGGPLFGMLPAEWREPIYGAGGVIRSSAVIVGAMVTLMTGMIQLMLIGEGSTMSARRFSLYGIKDHRLQFGLLVSGLTGLPAITGMICLLLWALAYRPMGAAAVVTALVAAPLAVITMMSISRLIISLATTLVTSKHGKNVFYVVVIILFITICQLPSILVNNSVPDDGTDVVSLIHGLGTVATVVAWTPFGAVFQLPFDVMGGQWGVLALHIVILAVTWVLCFLGCTWCLKHERLTLGAAESTVRIKGIGAFGWMPDSPSGAVSARLLTYLRRDPRQGLMFVMPVFFVVIFAFQAHGISAVIWQALIWGGWMMSIAESNGLAYDGRGFTMQVISGVPGRVDRVGRVRVYAGIIVVYLLALAVIIAMFTGDWSRPDRLVTGLIFTAVALGLAFSALGVAEVVSCVLMYPVASMDKPFSAPQGRAMAQGFFPFVYLFGSFLLLLPTGIVAAALAIAGVWSAMSWLMIPVSLANGVIVLAVGSWLGGKLMDARMLTIVRTLDSFASLQK